MGCSASSSAANEAAINQAIQTAQHKAELAASQTVKILILGSGDSGKTTFRKQLRVLYGEGFPLAVRKQIAHIVVSNLIEGMQDVLNALPQLGLNEALLQEAALQSAASAVLALDTLPPFLSTDLSQQLRALIQSSVVKEAVERRREFQLQDCWLAFSQALVANADWGTEHWTPNTEECVSVRVRTSGIVEETLKIKNVTFQLFDVGGQRAERKKWAHSFDNVTSVLFITAISEYDQVLYEDRSVNRLEEALALFEEISNSTWFATMPIILFLNKRDLFEQKFVEKKIPLNISGKFPQAPSGEEATLPAALDWLTREFVSKRKSGGNSNNNKQIYAHVTTATDADNFRKVFDACQKIIIRSNLEKAGFFLDQ